jgi:hypothetical protein
VTLGLSIAAVSLGLIILKPSSRPPGEFVQLISVVLFCALTFADSAPTAPALVYSTYLREAFTPNAIATDSAGNIYVAGDVVVDPVALHTTIVVVKLNPQASRSLYVRYLGGSV